MFGSGPELPCQRQTHFDMKYGREKAFIVVLFRFRETTKKLADAVWLSCRIVDHPEAALSSDREIQKGSTVPLVLSVFLFGVEVRNLGFVRRDSLLCSCLVRASHCVDWVDSRTNRRLTILAETDPFVLNRRKRHCICPIARPVTEVDKFIGLTVNQGDTRLNGGLVRKYRTLSPSLTVCLSAAAAWWPGRPGKGLQ